MPLTLRDYYLTIGLDTVRSVELENIRFFDSLSDIGYKKVMAVICEDEKASVNEPHNVRNIIGRTALPMYMENYDHVVIPRIKIAVDMWEFHCMKFDTDAFVTERTVLEQWVEESCQYAAFVAMRSIETACENHENFKQSTCMHEPPTLQQNFPNIYAWQLLHERGRGGRMRS